MHTHIGKNVDVASMNLDSPLTLTLSPKGRGKSFPLPFGERTKVRGKLKLLNIIIVKSLGVIP